MYYNVGDCSYNGVLALDIFIFQICWQSYDCQPFVMLRTYSNRLHGYLFTWKGEVLLQSNGT